MEVTDGKLKRNQFSSFRICVYVFMLIKEGKKKKWQNILQNRTFLIK